jgi:hypothetical protein
VKSSIGRSISYFTTPVSRDLVNSQFETYVLKLSPNMIFSEEAGYFFIKNKTSSEFCDDKDDQKFVKVIEYHFVRKLIDPDVELENWLRTQIAQTNSDIVKPQIKCKCGLSLSIDPRIN